MRENVENKCIIFGIGNSGRQDDGLGWLFLDYLKSQNSGMELEYRYQLQIEDAELISNYNTVIFVDATKEDIIEGLYLKPCLPSEEYSFSTHALAPETILFLSNKLYNHKPKAFIFAIQGYEWELKNGITPKAKKNLSKAKKFFLNKLTGL